MGFFTSTNNFQADIEKATSEQNITEKWGIIMDICDRIGTNSANAKECLKIIIKRLNHADPHVNMQAITLLDACVNNCGKNFHLEVASREFETEFRKLISKSQPQVVTKLKQCLKSWAEGDFKSDPQLNLIPSLYQQLKSKGFDFTDSQTAPKREIVLSKDPNVVSSQQEQDDIAKAIELSLKETSSPKASGGGAASLYPSVNSAVSAVPAPEPRKVRALYDFEAAEDNELTFKAGEIIMVLEDSDPNWWKGQNHRGEGLFPSNFVTADLSVEPEKLDQKTSSSSGTNKKVQSEEPQNTEQKDAVAEINEDSIDRLLFLLHEADPEDPSQDSPEMLRLENIVNQMGPLIDSELERVDRRHAQLTQLSGDLVEAINLYHSLMRESDRVMSSGSYMNFPGAPQPPMGYPGAPMPGMYGNMYGTMPNMMGMPGMSMPPNFPPSSMPGYAPPSSAPPFIPSTVPPTGYPPQNLQMPPQQLQNQNPNPNLPNGHNQNNDPNSNPQFQQAPQQPQQMPPMNNMLGPNQLHQMSQPPIQGNNAFPSQMNGMMNGGQANFPQMNPQQQQQQPPPTTQPQNQQQISHMMGNLSLNPGMNNPGMHHQLQPQHHPVTFIQQNDANQNIPIYQQQR